MCNRFSSRSPTTSRALRSAPSRPRSQACIPEGARRSVRRRGRRHHRRARLRDRRRLRDPRARRGRRAAHRRGRAAPAATAALRATAAVPGDRPGPRGHGSSRPPRRRRDGRNPRGSAAAARERRAVRRIPGWQSRVRTQGLDVPADVPAHRSDPHRRRGAARAGRDRAAAWRDGATRRSASSRATARVVRAADGRRWPAT